MNIYHSLKNHSLLNYMHECGCCDLKMLAYYGQDDIIAELKQNYEPVAAEIEALYELSELQIKKEEESEKEESVKKESDSKPREIEYVEGLDDLLESIKKSGSIRRSDKEVLMASMDKGSTRADGLHKPYYISPECSKIVDVNEKRNNFKILKEEKREEEEVEMRDSEAYKYSSLVAFEKREHLHRAGIPVYHREKLRTKRQRVENRLKRSYTNEKNLEKKFEGMFYGKEFIEQAERWDIPYFMRSKKKVKENDSESEKLEAEKIIPQHTVDRKKKVEVPEQVVVPKESKKYVKDTECLNKFFAGRDGDKTENEALMMREELRTPSEISTFEVDISESDSLLNEGTVVSRKVSQFSERKFEEIGEEKKEKTEGLAEETKQEEEAEPLVTKAANLKSELHKYVLDEMVKVVMPHFECKRQHPEFKKVHRNLITQKEHINLLSTLSGW
ncbi:uncharacterized protein isoform X2 [Rhodnius prolixus]|uniref:uncharacterized protein isoform X2 n=1 Tax=Rhodnius prolixus TaxID=13249 RepID=UPI003D1885CC